MGNIYLNELDTYVKHTLGIKHYIRYCDDFVLFGTKQELAAVIPKVQDFVNNRLQMKLSKCDLFPVTRGKVKHGKVKKATALGSIESTKGWIRWANTHNLAISLEIENVRSEIEKV